MTSVLFDTLPATAESVGTWPWSRIFPYYEDLLARPLSAETISDWLRDWTRIGSLIDEAGVRFTIATTTNTADAKAESEYTVFLQQILPEVLAVEQRVKQKLLESGLEPSGFGVALRELRTDATLFRPENSVLLAEERQISLEYDKISGAQTVLWEGKDVPLVQVYPVLQETDWERRAAARALCDRRSPLCLRCPDATLHHPGTGGGRRRAGAYRSRLVRESLVAPHTLEIHPGRGSGASPHSLFSTRYLATSCLP